MKARDGIEAQRGLNDIWPGDEYPDPPLMTTRPLKCPGVGRDRDCINALQFYFSRPVTDDEMRFLHDVIQRAVACMPKQST